MDELVEKYRKELTDIKPPMRVQYAEGLDLTIKHINTYDELDDNQKEHKKYMDGFALITDQEYGDLCFYDTFIKKHQELLLQPPYYLL